MWVWWKAPPEAMFSWLYSQVRVQPGLIYSILITGAEFSCNHTVCSASTQSLLSSISDVFFMIKIGFLVYCSWADLLKEKCFVTFYVSFGKRKCPFSSSEEYLTPYRELALCLSRRLPSLAREESLFCCTCFKVCSFMGSWHTESLIFARYWVPSARYWVPSYPLQPKRSWLLLASVKSGPRRPQVVFNNYLYAFACQSLSELIFLAYERFEALMTLACN